MAQPLSVSVEKGIKSVFFDEYEQKDVVKYQKIFLNKIQSLLSYFVKFSNNRSILPKVYPENYTIGSLDQRLIIILTNDKNLFFVNDS